MKCVMCPCSDISLLKLQTYIDNKTLKEITFVLPNFIIPEVQGPLYACATCSKQVTSFYEIKKSCVKNWTLLKQRKKIIKEPRDVQCNELNIVINYVKVPEKQERDKKFKCNSNYQDVLFSKDAEDDEDEDQLTEKFSNSTHDEESIWQRASKKSRFKCRDCEKAFTMKRLLEKHSRVHTEERRYKCPTCQKTFNKSSYLMRHKLTHTGEKPHKCDICYKTFNDKSNLRTHKRLHRNLRPYNCSVCSKTFTNSGNLSRHMRAHTGVKPHQCHVCPYNCARASDLKQHIRTHTGEKPYACKLCQKSFTQSHTLKHHERKLHNDKHFI